MTKFILECCCDLILLVTGTIYQQPSTKRMLNNKVYTCSYKEQVDIYVVPLFTRIMKIKTINDFLQYPKQRLMCGRFSTS